MAGIFLLALILFVSLCHLPPPAGSVLFNFPTFNQENQKDIRIEGDASFSSVGLIDISANRYMGSNGNSTGRASYAHPVLLWDKATGQVASFTTRFSFAIDLTEPNNKGDGMTFFLASYASSLPAGSSGYNLGLTNQRAGAVASGNSRFVAVEFDTYNDTEVHDPDTTYDHLGIDVNSLISANTSSLPNFSLRGSMNATIEYDNVSSILAVTLSTYDESAGEGRTYSLLSKVDLKSALPEQVAVGFSASTGASVELHQLLSWYFNSSLD